MSVCRFTLSTRASGRLRTVQVIVYKDVARLRKAASQWRPKPESHYDRAEGVTHCIERRRYEPSGNVILHPSAGIIRLWEGRLTPEVVTHEATHMACGIYRQDCNSCLPEGIEEEEVLAYLVGDVSKGIVNGLYRHGLWAMVTAIGTGMPR